MSANEQMDTDCFQTEKKHDIQPVDNASAT